MLGVKKPPLFVKLKGIKIWQVAVTGLAVLMSLFHLYTGMFGTLEPLVQRLIHVAFALSLVYVGIPDAASGVVSKKSRIIGRAVKLIMIGFLLLYIGYFFINYRYLASVRFPYVQPLSNLEVIIGTGMLIVVLDAARRLLGWSMTLVGIFFVVYALVGKWLPGLLHHSGYTWNLIIDNLLFTTDGVLGVAIAITATYVVLFIIFGSFLVQTGFGEFLLNLSLGVAGRLRGGPGKVSVIASGLMGMINGSAVACTLTVGSFTLPLMEKTGYNKEFAAGAISVGGSGGQLMPPLMGAQAFLMSQFTGIPYIGIIKLSLIPAILYYMGIWFAMDVEARKGEKREGAVNVSLSPEWRKEVRARAHMIVPIIVLVVLLVAGFTPMLAVVYSILSLITLSFIRPETRLNLNRFVKALEDGAMLSLSVVSATAVAGVIVGMVTVTGIGERLSYSILLLAGGNVLLALIFTSLISILLGMGLPTIPAYIVQVSVIVPALVKLGIPLYAAHMFVIYYACLSKPNRQIWP